MNSLLKKIIDRLGAFIHSGHPTFDRFEYSYFSFFHRSVILTFLFSLPISFCIQFRGWIYLFIASDTEDDRFQGLTRRWRTGRYCLLGGSSEALDSFFWLDLPSSTL